MHLGKFMKTFFLLSVRGHLLVDQGLVTVVEIRLKNATLIIRSFFVARVCVFFVI